MQKTNKKSSDFPQIYLAAATSDDDDDDRRPPPPSHHHHHDDNDDIITENLCACWQMKMAEEKKDERDRAMDLDATRKWWRK